METKNIKSVSIFLLKGGSIFVEIILLNENIAKKEVNGVNVTVRIDNVTGAAKYAMEFNVDVTDAVSTVSVKVDITAAITITLKSGYAVSGNSLKVKTDDGDEVKTHKSVKAGDTIKVEVNNSWVTFSVSAELVKRDTGSTSLGGSTGLTNTVATLVPTAVPTKAPTKKVKAYKTVVKYAGAPKTVKVKK